MLDRLDELCATALADHGCLPSRSQWPKRARWYAPRRTGADVAAFRPATDATRVRVGVLAADEGVLHLEKPVPLGAGGAGHAPAVRQLLQHAGGLTAPARINTPLLGLELLAGEGNLRGFARASKDGDREGLLGDLLSHPCELEPR